MSKRKVLFFHRTLKQSGAARQLINIFLGLDRSRFDPFFVLEHEGKRFYREPLEGARVHVLGPKGAIWSSYLRELLAVLDRERPDCIQSFNPRGNAYFYAASFLRDLPLLYCAVRNTEQPWVYRLQEALLQSRHRGMIVNSRAIRDQLVGSGVRPGKIHLIYNGVDTDQFSPCDASRRAELRRQHEVSDDELLVLSVGRIDPQKDIGTTIAAVASLIERGIDARFVNVGLAHKARYEKRLAAQAEQLGIAGRCEFVGPVANVSDYYQLADVMVLASEYEGLPNVLLENMACGRISVVSSAADNDDVVTDGVTGFHFPVGDVEALAARLVEVQALGLPERDLMSEAACKEASKRFSLTRMVERFEELYEA